MKTIKKPKEEILPSPMNLQVFGPILDKVKFLSQESGQQLEGRVLIDSGSSHCGIAPWALTRLRPALYEGNDDVRDWDGSKKEQCYSFRIEVPELDLSFDVQGGCICNALKEDGEIMGVIGRDLLKDCYFEYHGASGEYRIRYPITEGFNPDQP